MTDKPDIDMDEIVEQAQMTRAEWDAVLRRALRDNLNTEALSRTTTHSGTQWTARLCYCPNCRGDIPA